MNIWTYYKSISRRLLIWSGLSVLAGLVLVFLSPLWAGVGTQAIGWGLVDAAIAVGGGLFIQRRHSQMAQSEDPNVLATEARRLRTILWINAGLDVFYISGGLALALLGDPAQPFWRGTGWGIVPQGAFLLLFDSLHALNVPRPNTD